jgi:uncharacterized protein (DUF4415 family)
MPKIKMDAEMQEFAASVLESIGQAKRGEGRVTTPEQIAARRTTGPAGGVQAVQQVATTIHFDADVISALQASGPGWEARVNIAVREWLRSHPEHVASETN